MSVVAAQLPMHRWNYEEWDQMVASGVFEGKRVELIDGKVVDMSPQAEPHVVGIILATREIIAAAAAKNSKVAIADLLP